MWRFCPRCGGELRPSRGPDKIERPTCTQCGFVVFDQPKVGAGVIFTQNGRILLLRRAQDPWAGYWNLPAGYLEKDESPEAAAVREAREETGLDGHIDRLFGVFHFTDDPRGSGILVVYVASLVGGDARTDGEAAALEWFERSALPDRIAGGGHDSAIRAWWAMPA